MAQRNVTTSGSHLAKALVTPTGATTDVTLANVAQAALSVASANAAGRVELATSAETATGQDATRAVTPAGLAAQKFIKSTDVTYKALNDNVAVGSGSSQVARGNHGHAAATATSAGYLSAADKAKLDGIEAKATADQTGAEIIAAVNAELGGSQWQQGGGTSSPHTHSAADLPDRGAFYGKALGASLTDKNSTVEVNIAGLPGKAAAAGADLVPIWDPQAAAHRHVAVAGLPAGRGIVAPAGDDPAISMELPAAVNRRDFLLGFTATGAVTTTKVATAADVDEMAARGMTTIDTIAELRAYRPRRKDATVYVRGYHTPGDGGGGTFVWDAESSEIPDSGMTFAGSGGSTVLGRWNRDHKAASSTRKFVNVRWFGAKGIFSGDDSPAIQAAINYAGTNGYVFVPPGRYIINNTLSLFGNSTFAGESANSSGIWAATGTNPAIKVNDSVSDIEKRQIMITNVGVGGSGGCGIRLFRATNCYMHNIIMGIHCATDAIYAENCWGSSIRNVQFYGKCGNACINFNRPTTSSGNHALTIDNVYTSNSTPYGILIDAHNFNYRQFGCTITGCTLQGHPTAALAILSGEGISVIGLYTEATGCPIRLGNLAAGKVASGVHISGSVNQTYSAPILLDNCGYVTFTGCYLNVNNTATCITYNKINNVQLIGCRMGGAIFDTIKRVSGADGGSGFTLIDHQKITMKSVGTTQHQHYTMSVDQNGNWMAESWIPTVFS